MAAKRGRPPKRDTDRRSERITVWLTPADAALIRSAAGSEPLSAFFAAAGRARAGRPIEETRGATGAELRRLLGPAAGNLNQLARAVNRCAQRCDDPALVRTLAERRAVLAHLGAAVQELLAR